MIYRSTAIVFIMACLSLQAYGQLDSTSNKAIHFVGLQANQLIRQLLNFGNNSAVITNPYLVNYSFVDNQSRHGMNVGLGYTFDQTKTGDATNDRETNINALFFRVGYERKIYIAKRWLLGIGGDLLAESEKNETTSKTDFGDNESTIVTNNKESGFGLGPRLSISYRIANSIFLGTEATYYFKSLKNKGEIKSTTTFHQQGQEVTQTEKTETDDKFKRLQLNPPAVLWLIVKF